MQDQEKRDEAANKAAIFHPYDRQGDSPAYPCIEIGGAQVYAYVKDGMMRVSVDLDEAADPAGPFRLYGADRVPVVIAVQGETVFEATRVSAVRDFLANQQ